MERMEARQVAEGQRATVSVVIPCYRSEQTIAQVVDLTRAELVRLGYDSEFVLVNDNSPDSTYEQIKSLASCHDDVIAIDLAKNFGQHAAIMCGLHHVSGELVLLMDDDMQTHPTQVPILLGGMTPDVDVVFGKYPKRREALWRRAGSRFSHWTMRVFSGYPADVEISNFVVLRSFVAEGMLSYEGPFPTVQGLIFQVTSRIANVDVQHFDRVVGKSGYTLRGLIRLWMTLLNSTMLPLRVSSMLGASMGVVGFLAALVLIVRKCIDPSVAIGWSSVMVVALTCSGLILLCLGLVGEYVGRLFLTANKVPQYVERECVGEER